LEIVWNCIATLSRGRVVRHDKARKEDSIQSRDRAFRLAFDYALELLGDRPPLQGRKLTLIDARLAVRLSHFRCGPVARAAERHLAALGIEDVAFLYVGGHYVLRDGRSGLIHDLEAPCGCRTKQELPLWHRWEELADIPNSALAEEVFEKYACSWLSRRHS